jgi:hypothetical protein
MKAQVQKTRREERDDFHLIMIPIRWPRAFWRAYYPPYYVTFLTPQRARGVEFVIKKKQNCWKSCKCSPPHLLFALYVPTFPPDFSPYFDCLKSWALEFEVC